MRTMMMRISSLAVLCALLPAFAAAEIGLSLGHSVPRDEALSARSGAMLDFGHGGWYVFGSVENVSFDIVGQTMRAEHIEGVGIGYRFPIADDLRGFVSIGRYQLELETHPQVRDEIVGTTFKQEHGTPPFQPTAYSYEVERGYGMAFGVTYTVRPHVDVFVRARYARLDEFFEMSGPCECPTTLWQHGSTVDLSAMQAGIRLWLR